MPTNPNIFQLIDLDRTLFDTTKFATVLTEEINEQYPGLGSDLNARVQEAYQKEETFFLLRYLREEWGDEWFEGLVDYVVAKYGADAFKLPAAQERLTEADTLTSYAPAWGILSYGDEADQRMKARIIGLEHAPLYLTQTPEKGDIIQGWQTPSGSFQLPAEFGGGEVEGLTFEDDKLRAFKNLPEGVTGYWITRDPSAEHRIASEGLAVVVAVSGLATSLARIKEKYS